MENFQLHIYITREIFWHKFEQIFFNEVPLSVTLEC